MGTNSCLAEADDGKDEPFVFEPLLVEAKKFKTKDTEATYASEIYNQKEIIESGAKTIYDFLNQNTYLYHNYYGLHRLMLHRLPTP